MKQEFEEDWERFGHVHISAAHVPWSCVAVGQTNVRAEMVCGTEQAKLKLKEAWAEVQKAIGRTGVREEVGRRLRQAERQITIKPLERATEERFREETVMEFRCKSKGLVRSVLDRNPGQLWLSCPHVMASLGMQHFKHADSEQEFRNWDAEQQQQEKPSYWRVDATEQELLQQWREDYEHRRREKCGRRWYKWATSRSCISRARWQCKQKDVGKVRAIFNGTRDPTVREMATTAKCVSLIRRTVGTADFALGSGLELTGWLRAAEDQLSKVYMQTGRAEGDRNRL